MKKAFVLLAIMALLSAYEAYSLNATEGTVSSVRYRAILLFSENENEKLPVPLIEGRMTRQRSFMLKKISAHPMRFTGT